MWLKYQNFQGSMYRKKLEASYELQSHNW
jgi:hypothetical protein